MAGLTIRRLSKTFGARTVLSEIDFNLPPGSRKAVIGPNGAGKTVFGRLIAGRLRPSGGSIRFNGQEITRLPEHRRVRQGIAMTFANTALFQHCTVRENLRLALLEREGRAMSIVPPVSRHPEIEGELVRILADFQLSPVADVSVSRLAYGQQRLLEIALTLALRPRLLILDEPAAGIPVSDSHMIAEALSDLPPELSVLLIEHSPSRVPSYVDTVTVLVNGMVLFEGCPSAAAADRDVRALYRGHPE